jgi:hypothetical protein
MNKARRLCFYTALATVGVLLLGRCEAEDPPDGGGGMVNFRSRMPLPFMWTVKRAVMTEQMTA